MVKKGSLCLKGSFQHGEEICTHWEGSVGDNLWVWKFSTLVPRWPFKWLPITNHWSPCSIRKIFHHVSSDFDLDLPNTMYVYMYVAHNILGKTVYVADAVASPIKPITGENWRRASGGSRCLWWFHHFTLHACYISLRLQGLRAASSWRQSVFKGRQHCKTS